MSEQKKPGRTFVDWNNMKKTSVQINKDGSLEEIPQEKPKTLEDLLERRRKRMGR